MAKQGFKKPEEKAKEGRPRVEIDWDVLDALLMCDPSIHYCAGYLGVSVDTIKRNIREEKNMTFSEYKDIRLSVTASEIKSKVVTMAKRGSLAACRYVLANISDWRDKVESTNVNLENEESIEQYLERLQGVNYGKED